MFHFPLKERDQREEAYWCKLICAILEHVIIVSNTIKTSDIYKSRSGSGSVSGFWIPCFSYACHWHAFYLFSGQGIPRILQGEILVLYHTFVSLTLEAIYMYLPVLKSLVHSYEMWQMNRLWITQIYLLISLNDILVIPTTKCITTLVFLLFIYLFYLFIYLSIYLFIDFT